MHFHGMRRRDLRSGDGYTYVELLVVITILGILVALMLPAVQAAREAARRSSCANNLTQLITGMQSYEAHYTRFPPGTVNATGPIRSLPSGYHHSWIVQLLPYIDDKNAYAHVNKRISIYDPAQRAVRRLHMRVLRCSSAPYSQPGYSDYAAVHNDFEAPIDVTNNGSFYLNSRTRYDDLKDGSSQTLFIGEKVTLQGDLGWASGTRATLRNTGVIIRSWRNSLSLSPSTSAPDDRNIAMPESTLLSALFGDRETLNAPESTSAQASDQAGATAATEQQEPQEVFSGMEDAVSYRTGRLIPIPKDPQLAVGGFGGYHPGGFQFAWGDGGVRFISATIDEHVYMRLGHRNDGELLSYDW